MFAKLWSWIKSLFGSIEQDVIHASMFDDKPDSDTVCAPSSQTPKP